MSTRFQSCAHVLRRAEIRLFYEREIAHSTGTFGFSGTSVRFAQWNTCRQQQCPATKEMSIGDCFLVSTTKAVASISTVSCTRAHRFSINSTKDAFRPGEFTATIRTEQYRDLLRAEKAIMEKHRDPEKDQEAAQVPWYFISALDRLRSYSFLVPLCELDSNVEFAPGRPKREIAFCLEHSTRCRSKATPSKRLPYYATNMYI